MEQANNVVDWFSIASTDFERGVTFYETILGITMSRMTMPDGTNMAFFQAPELPGVSGDINDSKDIAPSENGVLIFLAVEGRLDDVLGRVEAARGTVVSPKVNIGQWGYIAKFKDTEGNVVGLHSNT